MANARCQNCKEYPFRWTRAYDDNGNRGLSCSLCGHIRIPRQRFAPVRHAREVRFDALLAKLNQGDA